MLLENVEVTRMYAFFHGHLLRDSFELRDPIEMQEDKPEN